MDRDADDQREPNVLPRLQEELEMDPEGQNESPQKDGGEDEDGQAIVAHEFDFPSGEEGHRRDHPNEDDPKAHGGFLEEIGGEIDAHGDQKHEGEAHREDDGFVGGILDFFLFLYGLFDGRFVLLLRPIIQRNAVIVREIKQDVHGRQRISQFPFRDGFIKTSQPR